MRVGSPRWWFENRETGEITIGQFPNWPLWGIGASWLLVLVAGADSTLGRTAGWAASLLWVYWGADEIIRGVNPWRRALGAVVVLWQVLRLVR